MLLRVPFGYSASGECLCGWIQSPARKFLPEAHLSNRAVLEPYAEEVRHRSDDMLTIRIYSNGQLGRNPREQLELIEKGIADIALIAPSYYPELFADLNVVALPNLVQNATQGSLSLTRAYERGLIREFRSFVVLSMFTTYPAIIHSNKKIEKLDDLKGLKILYTGDILRDVLKSLGANPVRINYSEIYPAIERGAMDAVALSWRSMYEGRFYEVTKHSYKILLGANPIFLAMNRRRFETLSNDHQNILVKLAGQRLAAIWGRAYDGVNESYERRLEDKGHEIITPSRAQENLFEQRTEPLIREWSSRGDRRRLLDAFREQAK